MSFYSKIPKKTPIDVWEELKDSGARILETIPFGSSFDEMEGFISICGKGAELPLMTICISNPIKDKCLVTNVVFRSLDHYNSFLNSLNIDLVNFFDINNEGWD